MTAPLSITAGQNPVTGRSTKLRAIDGSADSSQTAYEWAVTGKPFGVAAPTFIGGRDGKSATVTFSQAGVYTFSLTAAAGPEVRTASLMLAVSQVISGVDVDPASASLFAGGTKRFTASARDQFGVPVSMPTIAWSVEPPTAGAVDGSGLFAASARGGRANVRATIGGKSAVATVTVAAAPKVNAPPLDDVDSPRHAMDAGDAKGLQAGGHACHAALPGDRAAIGSSDGTGRTIGAASASAEGAAMTLAPTNSLDSTRVVVDDPADNGPVAVHVTGTTFRGDRAGATSVFSAQRVIFKSADDVLT